MARRKIILVLMVKNESHIIQRCLESALSICDAFCIVDTGSTDETVAVAQRFLESKAAANHWTVAHNPWVNFGHNRSLSFREGVDLCSRLGWDPNSTWALFLDGDMVLKVGERFSKDMCLKDAGYQVMQKQGTLEYYNLRLARMDIPWRCTGATHEYWESGVSGERDSTEMEPELLAIDDVNDGGAKADKFERDIRLLLAEHEADPANARTLFYLAQSYQNSGHPEQAIPWYKKRLEAGGWHEEGWYCKLSLGRCYLAIKQPIDAEYWYLDCYEGNHHRAEPLYELAKHFRDVGDHFKAMHYCLKGLAIPKPSKGLFVDAEVYSWKLRFERTILDYYITRRFNHTSVLEHIVTYLAEPQAQLKDQVFANLKFYIMPLITREDQEDYIAASTTSPHAPTAPLFRPPTSAPTLLRTARYTPYNFPLRLGTYCASSMSVAQHPSDRNRWIANVRYVNYRLGDRALHDGKDLYIHPPGSVDSHRILTRNFLCELDPVTFDILPGTLCAQPWNDFLPEHLPRHTERNVLGLEDIRLFHPSPAFTNLFPAQTPHTTTTFCPSQFGFMCAQMEYTPYGKIRIAMGLMDVDRFTCTHGAVVESPHGEEMWCEKNWIPLAGGTEWIYAWHPLRIGRVSRQEDGALQLKLGAHEYATPYIFNHFRGSSTPVRFRGQLWLVTHLKYLEGSTMTYVHFLLALDETTYRPLRYSVPFFFRTEGVEFCMSIAISMAGDITFFFSQRDSNPARITCPLDEITMIEI
jgi:glycosyltransferase involved in cell wall biosynthesis